MSEQAGPAPQRAIRWGLIAVWLLVGLVIFGLGVVVVRSFATRTEGGTAPAFTLTTFDDEEIRLEDLRGQVVVLNFWASWCAPCIEEAPDLERAWQSYRDQGVMFIGVAYVDSAPKSLAFIAEHGITYPNGPDTGTRIADAYQIRGVPETFIITPSGQISFYAQRPLNFEELSREIERAMAQEGG